MSFIYLILFVASFVLFEATIFYGASHNEKCIKEGKKKYSLLKILALFVLIPLELIPVLAFLGKFYIESGLSSWVK